MCPAGRKSRSRGLRQAPTPHTPPLLPTSPAPSTVSRWILLLNPLYQILLIVPCPKVLRDVLSNETYLPGE